MLRTSSDRWRIASDLVEEAHVALYLRDALGLDPVCRDNPPPLTTPPKVRTWRLLRGTDRAALAAAWGQWWERILGLRTTDSVFNPRHPHIDSAELRRLVEKLGAGAWQSHHQAWHAWMSDEFDAPDGDAVTALVERSRQQLGAPAGPLSANLLVIAADDSWHTEPRDGFVWCSRGTLADRDLQLELLAQTFTAA